MSAEPTNTERLLTAFGVRRADGTQADRNDYRAEIERLASSRKDSQSEYENILAHMEQHREYRGVKGGVKQWLLEGAKRESARTIYEAVKRIPEDRLLRRLARALAKG